MNFMTTIQCTIWFLGPQAVELPGIQWNLILKCLRQSGMALEIGA